MSMQPAIFARHDPMFCGPRPARPGLIYRAVPRPLLRHARRHGPAQHLTEGTVPAQ
jgi:hypothetical protein